MALSKKIKQKPPNSGEYVQSNKSHIANNPTQVDYFNDILQLLKNTLEDSLGISGFHTQIFADLMIEFKQDRPKCMNAIILIISSVQHLAYTIENTSNGSEDQSMESVYSSASFILDQLGGLQFTSRRSLLDEIARVINDKFDTYKFISPEQTMLVDPTIHDAQGKSGLELLFGLTYTVINKESGKTIKYAIVEIK